MEICDCCGKTGKELYKEILCDRNGDKFAITVCEKCHWRINKNSISDTNN